MAWHPSYGFREAGLDLASVDAYRSADRRGLALPPLAFESKTFQDLEDEQIWTREWVCVGLASRIPSPGDLLPFSVGFHGTHVERLADGGLRAGFNVAQHGGCRSVPEQCKTGKRTRCSYTACGYSRDRDVIPAGEIASAGRDAMQYLGSNPAKLRPIALQAHGGALFLNLDASPRAFEPFELIAIAHTDGDDARAVLHLEREVAANWKCAVGAFLDDARSVDMRAEGEHDGAIRWWPHDDAARRLAALAVSPADRGGWVAGYLFPNLFVARRGAWLVTCIVQPTSPRTHLQRWDVTQMAGAAADPPFRFESIPELLGLSNDAVTSVARGRVPCGSPDAAAAHDRTGRRPGSAARQFEHALICALVAHRDYAPAPLFVNPVFAARA